MSEDETAGGIRKATILVVIVAALIGGAFAAKGLFAPAHAGIVLKSVDVVVRGVGLFAAPNGGQIPPSRDLLADLESRGLAPDDDPSTLGGYSIGAVERLAAGSFRVMVTCPPTPKGRQGCNRILAARAPGEYPNVLAVSGGGTTTVAIDFRL